MSRPFLVLAVLAFVGCSKSTNPAAPGGAAVHNAQKPLTVDDVRITVEGGKSRPSAQDTLAAGPDTLCFSIRVESTGDRAIRFPTWAASDKVKLTDDRGNQLLVVRPDKAITKQNLWDFQKTETVINPGGDFRDVLFFSLPSPKASFLILELPAENFGGKGTVQVRIDRDSIKGL